MPAKGENNAAANHLKILSHLLNSVDENKYCCDCDAKGPRWASWNLGLFLCIRCAGIHRNLGVHISKVKSVNLDSWTAEQIESVLRMGNKKAREIYEAQLPPGHRRPQEDYALEQFIRSKYEKKMYVDSQKLRDSNFEKVDINKYIASISGGRVKTNNNSKGSSCIPAPPSSASSSENPAGSPSTSKPQKEEKNTSRTSTPASVPPKQNVDELLNFGSSPPIVTSQGPQLGVTPDAVTTVKSVPKSATGGSGFTNTTSPSSDLAGLVFNAAQYNDDASLLSKNNSPGGDLFASNLASEDESSKSTSSCGKKTNHDILSLYKTASVPPSNTNGFSNVSRGGFSTGANPSSAAYQWNNQSSNSNSFVPNALSGQTNGNMPPPPQTDFSNRNSTLIGQTPFQLPATATANYSQGAFASQFGHMNLGVAGGARSFGAPAISTGNPLMLPHQNFNSMPTHTNSTYNNPFSPVSAATQNKPSSTSGTAGLHLSAGANCGILGQGQPTTAHNWNMAGNSFGSFSNTSGPFASTASNTGMVNGYSSFGMGAAAMASQRPNQRSHQTQSQNLFTPFQSQQASLMMGISNTNSFSSSGGMSTPSSGPLGNTAPSFNPYNSSSQQRQSLWLK